MNGRPFTPLAALRQGRPVVVGHAGPEEAENRRYRLLALRVIDLAIRDLTSPAGAAADRASARTFLAGSGMLVHWCAVAQLDPRRVIRFAGGGTIVFNGLGYTEDVKRLH